MHLGVESALFKNGKFRWKVTVPVNTTATVYVPTNNAESVKESGQMANEAPGIQFIRVDSDAAVYEVCSGRYSFVSECNENTFVP